MIPNFDHNHVIPPHIGNPTISSELSPYICDTLEFCKKFATSKERIVILKGFLAFRKKLNIIGIIDGFQWLDGSFTENIEAREKRPPNDLDLVTFYKGLTKDIADEINKNFIDFIDFNLSKKNYYLDHYPVDYGYEPNTTVELTRYWLQLFSHNRLAVWKGILRVELNTPNIDEEAEKFLDNIKL